MPRTLRDRAFQVFWRVQRPLTLGVRGVATDTQGRILLVRHTYTPGWHFPGGGVERRETCGSAIIREMEEEAGVRPTDAPELVSVHANHATFPNDHVLLYRIGVWSQIAATSHGEIADAGFFDPLDPPDGVTPGTSRRLKELFAGAAISETW